MMAMVVVVMVSFLQNNLCPDSGHPLLHHLVGNDFEWIDVERSQLRIQLVHRNAQTNQRPENHVPARPADAFKMQCFSLHDAGENGRFLFSRQAHRKLKSAAAGKRSPSAAPIIGNYLRDIPRCFHIIPAGKG